MTFMRDGCRFLGRFLLGYTVGVGLVAATAPSGAVNWRDALAMSFAVAVALTGMTAITFRGRLLCARLLPRHRICATKLDGARYETALATLRAFALGITESRATSSHLWQCQLEGIERRAFDELSHAPQLLTMLERCAGNGSVTVPLEAMNEIYVSAPVRSLSSDLVFYTPHVDGPLPLYPGAAVFRCMLAVNENALVHTHFPLGDTRYREPLTFTLTTGEAVAFDYHREPHFITSDAGTSPQPRISLKLHFLVHPRRCGVLGRVLASLTTCYNASSRTLFLSTISPRGSLARLGAFLLWAATSSFQSVERWVGWNNLLYVTACFSVSALAGDVTPLLVGTGFLHYLFFAGMKADRRQLSIARCHRNLVFYWAMSTAQLGVCSLLFTSAPLLSLAGTGVILVTAVPALSKIAAERELLGSAMAGMLVTFITLWQLPPSMSLVWLLPVHAAMISSAILAAGVPAGAVERHPTLAS